MTYPACIGGNGACPPEDCHDPAGFMDGSVHGGSWEALEDLGTMAEIIGPIVLERRPDILDDEETRWRLENALDRTRAPADAMDAARCASSIADANSCVGWHVALPVRALASRPRRQQRRLRTPVGGGMTPHSSLCSPTN